MAQQANQSNGNRPRCAVCNKPVSRHWLTGNAEDLSIKIRAECHGKTEERTLPRDELSGVHVAFADEAAALLMARLPEVQTKTHRLISLEE